MTKMLNMPHLLYWIKERERVRLKKEDGDPKPWSDDPVFQVTYFCNVRREDDKVTKFIRQMYSPHVHHGLFVHNIILSRFLNWPDTLEQVRYVGEWSPLWVKNQLTLRKWDGKKVWGNAYVVTTHGIKMDKIDYLCDRVMPSIQSGLHCGLDTTSCSVAAKDLMEIEGISTFMAGQVVADLKNTPEHPLREAHDWWDFALPGPGSIRGMDWLMGATVPRSEWHSLLLTARDEIEEKAGVGDLCAQDVQNCLCEFDKYMRVKHGTGRSKRSYNGR
jgi:hypothetical protein